MTEALLKASESSFASRAIEALQRLDEKRDEEKILEHRNSYSHFGALNDAAQAGYWWAKSEAESEMKPLAKKRLSASSRNRVASDPTRDKQRAKAEEWKQPARDLLRVIEGKHPNLSAPKVANMLLEQLKMKADDHRKLHDLVLLQRKKQNNSDS